MKKFFVFLLVAALLGAGGYYGWQYYQQDNAQPVAATAQPAYTEYTIGRGNLSKTVTVTESEIAIRPNDGLLYAGDSLSISDARYAMMLPSNNRAALALARVAGETLVNGDNSEITGETITLFYDDRYDVTGMDVEIIDAGTPTSYQVGYGVEENTVLDTAVITREGDTLIATGIGTATVKIDGVTYNVTVETAPISLLLGIGQSNMEGNEGEAKQSIACPDGMVYATYGDRYDMNITNATRYAPSALTGDYRTVNAEGGTDCLGDYPVYMLTEEGDGRKGPDSGFAYEWVQQTGEKVWP